MLNRKRFVKVMVRGIERLLFLKMRTLNSLFVFFFFLVLTFVFFNNHYYNTAHHWNTMFPKSDKQEECQHECISLDFQFAGPGRVAHEIGKDYLL